jgi:hypothetical protein
MVPTTNPLTFSNNHFAPNAAKWGRRDELHQPPGDRGYLVDPSTLRLGASTTLTSFITILLLLTLRS